jgi:hypothetical protein
MPDVDQPIGPGPALPDQASPQIISQMRHLLQLRPIIPPVCQPASFRHVPGKADILSLDAALRT